MFQVIQQKFSTNCEFERRPIFKETNKIADSFPKLTQKKWNAVLILNFLFIEMTYQNLINLVFKPKISSEF